MATDSTRWQPACSVLGQAFKVQGRWPYSNQYTASNARMARWALASSCLAAGYYLPTCDQSPDLDSGSGLAGDLPWWWDEYAVNLNTGKSSTSTRYKHWLGVPTSPARHIGSGVWRRDFDNGLVLVNGHPWMSATVTLEAPYRKIHGLPASLASDTTNNGRTVTTVFLPGTSGLFLLRKVGGR
jgi:hypothetical protein